MAIHDVDVANYKQREGYQGYTGQLAPRVQIGHQSRDWRCKNVVQYSTAVDPRPNLTKWHSLTQRDRKCDRYRIDSRIRNRGAKYRQRGHCERRGRRLAAQHMVNGGRNRQGQNLFGRVEKNLDEGLSVYERFDDKECDAAQTHCPKRLEQEHTREERDKCHRHPRGPDVDADGCDLSRYSQRENCDEAVQECW